MPKQTKARNQNDPIEETQILLEKEARIGHQNRQYLIQEAATIKILELISRGEVEKAERMQKFLDRKSE